MPLEELLSWTYINLSSKLDAASAQIDSIEDQKSRAKAKAELSSMNMTLQDLADFIKLVSDNADKI